MGEGRIDSEAFRTGVYIYIYIYLKVGLFVLGFIFRRHVPIGTSSIQFRRHVPIALQGNKLRCT